MELIPYIVAYIALGIFAVAVLARFFMWRRLPMHVRWELYPVAHEASRAHYGGSYLEEVDWWKKPRESSMIGELKVMIPEILFLVALKEHNPKLWSRSFPFHFGLYLVIGATVLMMLAGVMALVGLLPPSLATLLHYAILACAVAGLGLGLVGAVGLLQSRLTWPKLRDFSAPADLFNLVFFVAAFGLSLVNIILGGLPTTIAFVTNLVRFQMVSLTGTGMTPMLTVASVLLMGALVAYIPLTHMSHFVGKFFAYHAIRWNDEPNLRDGHEEGQINRMLNQPVTWSAPHIQGDGKKTWADIATEEIKK